MVKKVSNVKVKNLLIALIIIGATALIVVLEARPTPIGGELFMPDFKSGFDLYVEERYVQFIRRVNGFTFTQTPHSTYLVSDEHIKETVFSLCLEMEFYREFEGGYDVMLGLPSRYEFLPKISLLTDQIGYEISILNWDNHTSDAWASYPIRIELFGKPVLHVSRIDLSLKPESEDSYMYLRNGNVSDSIINREGRDGWYSTISQEHLDELLSLADSLSAENSEIIFIWSSE